MPLMSFNNKKIILRDKKSEVAKKIRDKFNLSEITSNILASRGYNDDTEISHFINPTFKSGLPNPSLIKDMDKALNLLVEAIKNNDNVAICCDFDVDGLTSSSQMQNFLSSLNV